MSVLTKSIKDSYAKRDTPHAISMNTGSKNNRIKRSVQCVVDKKICCGCGACTVVCPQGCIDLVHGERFNFPRIDSEKCIGCGKCLTVCPGAFLLKGTDSGFMEKLTEESFDCYLAHSNEEDVRDGGSSGGFITGMILHLMKEGLVEGGIVAKCEGENPLVAQSFVATDRDSLMSAQASKYAPVSNCAALAEVMQLSGRYVFVGTPCMVQGLTKVQEVMPELKDKISLKISFVCSGMTSRENTKAYLLRYGIDPAKVGRITYRGKGWPGSFRGFDRTGQVLLERPYLGDETEHLISKDHYLRCHNCLDHWGRFADIVACDPWNQDVMQDEHKGKSAIIVRTQRGAEALASAVDSGDMIAEPITITDMLGYNKPLVIDSEHPRHGWMAAYQLLFAGRVKYLPTILRALFRRQRIGLVTTIKARLDRNYFR